MTTTTARRTRLRNGEGGKRGLQGPGRKEKGPKEERPDKGFHALRTGGKEGGGAACGHASRRGMLATSPLSLRIATMPNGRSSVGDVGDVGLERSSTSSAIIFFAPIILYIRTYVRAYVRACVFFVILLSPPLHLLLGGPKPAKWTRLRRCLDSDIRSTTSSARTYVR